MAANGEKQRKVLVRASIGTAFAYGAFFLMLGVMVPFLPVWLTAKGLSVGQVATVLALQSVVRVAAMPVITYLADRAQARRGFIISLCALAFIAMQAALLTDGFVALAIWIVLASLAWSPVLPMLDAMAVEQAERGGVEYGRVRISGSVTFIVGSVGAGALLGWLDAQSLGWVLLATHALLGMSVIALREAPAHKRPRHELSIQAAGKALATVSFVLLVLVAGLTQAGHAVYYSFGSLHWEARGFSGLTIGWLWAIGVIAEIALFNWARGPMDKLGPAGLLLAGAGFATVRWLAMAVEPGLAATFALQVLHGASYGMTHLGTVFFIRRVMDQRFASTAQGVFGAFSGGVLMTGAIAAAGWAYALYGGGAYYLMAFICAVAFVLGLALKRLTP